MRIQTRLFLGTALLVLALMATQWWLHLRQLRAMEAELGAVAASVGKDILKFGPDVLMPGMNQETHGMIWVDEDDCDEVQIEEIDGVQYERRIRHDVHVAVIPEGSEAELTSRVTNQLIRTSPDGTAVVDEDGFRIRANRIEVETDGTVDVVDEVLGDGSETRFVLQVVSDTGVKIVFAGYWMLCIGAIWHMWLRHVFKNIGGKKQTHGN